MAGIVEEGFFHSLTRGK